MIKLEPPIAQEFIGDFLSLPSAENPDWGYARNKRCVLMTCSAEWVQSVYSCVFEFNGKTLITPNRDYPYEGLMVYQDGENWKFIDCIALALQDHTGRPLPVTVNGSWAEVKVNPWKTTYCYRVKKSDLKSDVEGEIPFFVSYYLNSQNTAGFITGCVELYFPQGLVHEGGGIVPILQPFIDIRHMYSGSDFGKYAIWESHRGIYKQLNFSVHNRTLTFYLPHVDLVRFPMPEKYEWEYKLGTGEREEREADPASGAPGGTCFKSEKKDIMSFFHAKVPLEHPQNFTRLFFGCGLADVPTKYFLPSLEKIFRESKRRDLHQYQSLEKTFTLPQAPQIRNAILARIAGLTKFKTYIQLSTTQEYVQAPHAGAWWFRTPWYRDVFEGILNSFETLMRLADERNIIKKIVLLALGKQDDFGRILRGIPEFKNLSESYDSSDGTLLCFIVAFNYIRRTRDLDFALDILAYAKKTILCFYHDANREPGQVDGPPRVDDQTGLLLGVPRHSWIDTRSQWIEWNGQTIDRLPNRVSPQFIRELFGKTAHNQDPHILLHSPRFFLPEINAQWITMLRGAIGAIDFVQSQEPQPGIAKDYTDLKKTTQDLVAQAEKSFKSIFWNASNGFLSNVVYENRRIRDEIECEAGITAAAMLGETVFTPQELESIWECARNKLLVYRRLVEYGYETWPFGVMARNVPPQVYYGDQQYHGDVVWLRSTPYLIKLLRLLKQEQIVREILLNTLDHQITESAIFYNQELLARPLGHNPHPDGRTGQNPVPVKNPIQFWSQWCDAFIEYFEERGS